MRSFRTKETQGKYQQFIEDGILEGPCKLCEERDDAVKEFIYWRIIKNDFPYDRIAEVHDMIVPKRHVTEYELTSEEWKEFHQIKNGYINEHYSHIFEATGKTKSLPSHFHIHLILPINSEEE